MKSEQPNDLSLPVSSSSAEEIRLAQVSSFFTRRKLLQTSVAVAAAAAFPRFAFASNPQPTPPGTIVNGTCSVSQTVIGTIPEFFNGFSFEKYQASTGAFTGFSSSDDLVALMARLSNGVIRFGGFTVDYQTWDANGAGDGGHESGGTIAPPDVNRVRDFVNAINATSGVLGYRVLWGINLNGTGTQATSPTAAAAEAVYVYNALGSNLLGIEIGNEPDNLAHYDQATYATKWKSFYDAIKAQNSNIPISAPVSAGQDLATWFASSSGYGPLVNSINTHYYRAHGGTTQTLANTVNPEPDTSLATLLSAVSSASSSISKPYRIAECNSATGGGVDGTSNTYSTALWGTEYLFQLAKAGASGCNFHGGSSSKYYSPITVYDDGTVGPVRPLYYGMYFFQMLDRGSVYQTTFSGNAYTRAYAVNAGNLKLMFVNTDSSHSLRMTITVYHSVTSANLIEMTQLTSGNTLPDLGAKTGVTIRGSAIGSDNSYSPSAAYDLTCSGSTITCYVPACSAVLVNVNF